MTSATKGRGGPGRKPLAAGQDTVAISLRLTVAQRDKMIALGGAAWMRRQIDAAGPTAALEASPATPAE